MHLLTLSISTIKSSVPTSYLDSHDEAREQLEGPKAEGGRGGEGAGGAAAGDWKEEVVNGIVGGLGWLKGSGVSRKKYLLSEDQRRFELTDLFRPTPLSSQTTSFTA